VRAPKVKAGAKGKAAPVAVVEDDDIPFVWMLPLMPVFLTMASALLT
jgi:hypothetical protein